MYCCLSGKINTCETRRANTVDAFCLRLFPCVQSAKTQIPPNLSSTADDTITQSGSGVLGPLFYICDGHIFCWMVGLCFVWGVHVSPYTTYCGNILKPMHCFPPTHLTYKGIVYASQWRHNKILGGIEGVKYISEGQKSKTFAENG